MSNKKYDVVGIGNAIVDVISKTTDEFLVSQGIEKHSMTLIDEARATELYGLMGPGIETSGGSAANTMAGIASFGGRAAYVGKVRDDQLGDVFAHDTRAGGVAFDVAAGTSGPATARSLILVTPDAARTMNTFLGISSLLEPADIDPALMAEAEILFCEGYLWDVDSAKEAMRKAMSLVAAAGGRCAMTASDSFCIDRHHGDFVELCEGPLDILFANRAELARLVESDDLETGIAWVRERLELTCITLGKQGSLLVTADETIEIEAEEFSPPVDTTGAGDQYAAGVLAGLARGAALSEAGRMGSVAAAEVIAHLGPRPEVDLAELAALG